MECSAEGTEWTFLLPNSPYMSQSCSDIDRKADTCGPRDWARGLAHEVTLLLIGWVSSHSASDRQTEPEILSEVGKLLFFCLKFVTTLSFKTFVSFSMFNQLCLFIIPSFRKLSRSKIRISGAEY